METLNKIGKRTGTDKCNKRHTFAGKSYLDIYDSYMSHTRGEPVSFLELGVRGGGSHRMWSQYFHSDSIIYGVDIDPKCQRFNGGNVKVFIGSQADPNVIKQVTDQAGKFDFILDDASHINELTLKSFKLLMPFLKRGGLYIIEDLATSYVEERLPADIQRGKWPGMEFNKNVEMVNHRKDMDDFFLNMIKSLDLETSKDVEWVHFYSKIAIIKKL